MELTSLTYTPRDKIKTPFAKMIVSGSKEKPVYEIMYIDPNDMQLHVGYASYNVEFVFQWLEDCFDIDDNAATKLAVVSGQELENNEADFIPRSSALGCVLGMYDRHRLKEVPGIIILPVNSSCKNYVEDALRTCPICGSKVEIVGVDNTSPFQVWCEKCGLQFGVHKDYLTYQLIETWNKRVGE